MKSIIFVCLLLSTFVKSDEPLPPLPEDGSCVLDKSYQDGCNVCTCFGEKALLCKRKEDCVVKHEEAGEPICKEGEVKNGPWGECEVCVCSKAKDGINDWFCDAKNCYAKRPKRGIGTIPDLKNTPCAPNDSFKLDCNMCYCNSAKSGYRCTEHICAPDNASEILIAQNVTSSVDIPSLNVTSETPSTTPLPTVKLHEATIALPGVNTTLPVPQTPLITNTTTPLVSNDTLVLG